MILVGIQADFKYVDINVKSTAAFGSSLCNGGCCMCEYVSLNVRLFTLLIGCTEERWYQATCYELAILVSIAIQPKWQGTRSIGNVWESWNDELIQLFV